MYSYPNGEYVGKLHDVGEPTGLCERRGSILVTEVKVGEGFFANFYPYGNTVRSYKLREYDGLIFSCAIDPINGSIALTNYLSEQQGAQVVVYRRPKGVGIGYSDPSVHTVGYCTYDDAGNLFIDGTTWPQDQMVLDELPLGGSKLVEVRLPVNFGFSVPSIQWADGYLTIAGYNAGLWIYRFRIHGSEAKLAGITKIGVGSGQYFIRDGVVAVPVAFSRKYGTGGVELFSYPDGKFLSHPVTGLGHPNAVAITP